MKFGSDLKVFKGTGPSGKITKADSYGNEKLIRKWTKSVFFIQYQKFGQADSYGNEKLIRKWTKSTGLGAF